MIKKINIEQINISGGTQPRILINQEIISDYMSQMIDGAKFPPVTVFFDGAGYWLADGFHRYWANIKLDYREMECEVRHGTQRDAVLFSCGANNEHGLRRTNADKRKSVMTLIEDDEWGKYTDVRIAEICKVSSHFVGNVRFELDSKDSHIERFNVTDEEPTSRTYINKHGQEATMNVSNIGRKPALSRIPDPEFYEPDEDYSQLPEDNRNYFPTPEEEAARKHETRFERFIEQLNELIANYRESYPSNPLLENYIKEHQLGEL